MGHGDRARQAIWLGTAATLVVFAVGFVLPERVPNVLWPLMYSYAIYGYAVTLFAVVTTRHYASGGKKGSWWKVTGISLAGLAIMFGILIAIVVAFPSLVPA